ncbi:DUF4365 domain-containing protein [Streptomyces canus]|uniref:DUF4365 domain-containing protein n=1 Tax=Streptomyces canus TaxID=58343 RepID=UPI003444E45D
MADPATWQQEQISIAYVHAVATQAGATVASWNVDKDGVDATLKRNHQLVELQMKCSFDAHMLADRSSYTFDLDVPTYDKLRGRYRTAAGYLGLVIVPRDVASWLQYDTASLLIRCAGFYAQIQDLPPAPGSATRVIHLPTIQRIDAAGLDVMFDYAHERLFGPGIPNEEAIA